MTSDSLIDRIKERQWLHGKAHAVYVDDVEEIMGDASTRKDEDIRQACVDAEKRLHEKNASNSPAQPSEISVLSIIEDAKRDYADFKKKYPDDEHRFYLIGFEIPDFLEYLRGYALRSKPEPVSKVDTALEKAAEILANFKPELKRDKLEEWQACYAMLFTQMNELVNDKKAEQPVGCREAFERWYWKGDVAPPGEREDDGDYASFNPALAWDAWQAAWKPERESGGES